MPDYLIYIVAVYIFMVICTSVAAMEELSFRDFMLSYVLFGILWPFTIVIWVLKRLRG